MDTRQILIATLVAPLSSIAIAALMFAEELIRNQVEISVGVGVWLLLIFTLSFVFVSAAFIVIVGLPIHYLLYRLDIKNVFVYCLLGVFVSLAYQYSTNMMPPSLQSTGYWVYCFTGLVVSFTFWFVAVKRART